MSGPAARQRAGRRRERLGVALVLLLAVALAGFGIREGLRVWRMRQELRGLQQEVLERGARQKELAEQAERLRSDPGYIEKRAREEMGMVREGDRVLKFPSQPPPLAAPPAR